MKSLKRTTLQYGVGTIVFTSCRMARDLLFARILGPAGYGVWAGLSIYRQYSGYSDLGATNGLGRMLPRLLEEGAEDDARSAMGMAWSSAMGSTLLFSVVLAIWMYLRERGSQPEVIFGAITIVALMFVDKQYMYVTILYRSMRRVGEIGVWIGMFGIVELVLGTILVSLFKIYGLYISLIVSSLIVVVGMSARQGISPIFRLDRRILSQLANISLVLMSYGLLSVAQHNVDRLAILAQFGAGVELGQYQIAAVIGLVVSQLPLIIMAPLAPEIYRFGKNDRLQLRQLLLLPAATGSVLAVLVASVLWLVLPLVFHRFLPEYILALPITRTLLLSEVLFSITLFFNHIVVALDRSRWNLIGAWGSVLFGFAVSKWALAQGMDLVTVAIIMCVVQALGLGVACSIALQGTRTPVVRFLLAVIGPLIYGAGILWGLGVFFGPAPYDLLTISVETLIGSLFLSPLMLVLLAYFEPTLRISQHIRHFLYAN